MAPEAAHGRGECDQRGRDIEEQDPPLYCTDEFRIYYMKVLPCSKRYCHDWTTCPFAHPGEKARRRDPRNSSYTGIACPDMKKDNVCVRGELCPYAHNVFEYWLHPTRYRTQLCNDGTSCRRRVCFFAHTLGELRVPSSKPFVNPHALAAASAAAGARRSGLTLESLASDVARNRGGHQSVGDAAELANRLAGLQMQQQPQQLQQQPQRGDQNAAIVQMLSQMLQQQQQRQQQQQQVLPPQGFAEQVPDAAQLAALYQQISKANGSLQQHQQQMAQQNLHHQQQFDPNASSQEEIAAALAHVDPNGQVYNTGGLTVGVPTDKRVSPDGLGGGAGQRCSMDIYGGSGHAEYAASNRSSFDTQARTPRASLDMSGYMRRNSVNDGRPSFESSRSSMDVLSTGRRSMDSVRGGDAVSHWGPPNPMDVAGFGPGAQLGSFGTPHPASAPMAFGPNGGYLLTGNAAAAAVSAELANGGWSNGQGDFATAPPRFAGGSADLRSASLPTYLPTSSGAGPGFQTMPGLEEGVPYDTQPHDLRCLSTGGPAAYGAAAAATELLPPRAPPRATSIDSGLDPTASRNGFQQHLMGALPGSFNSGTFPNGGDAFSIGSDSFFQDMAASQPQQQAADLLRINSNSSGNSGGSLFANSAQPSTVGAQVSAPAQQLRASSAPNVSDAEIGRPLGLPVMGASSRPGSSAGALATSGWA